MEKKRKRLIDIAIELFIGHGIISVTMDEIAKTAGMLTTFVTDSQSVN